MDYGAEDRLGTAASEVREKTSDDPREIPEKRRGAGLSRRNLLEGAAGVAILIALGGVGTALKDDGLLIRPPGGQDAISLLGSCIRCDRCQSVCPTGVIDTATVEDGLVNARTPKLNFALGYCDKCGGDFLCSRVCPTDAIKPFDSSTQKIAMAVIDLERCETYGISARCKAECVGVCPEEALSLDEQGRLVLDEASCWGCGACEHVCPSNSYRVYDGSTDRGINIRSWEGGENG